MCFGGEGSKGWVQMLVIRIGFLPASTGRREKGEKRA
jgi:hypothetical protein